MFDTLDKSSILCYNAGKMKKISLKQQRAIELARRFATTDEVSDEQWKQWLPNKSKQLNEDQLSLVRSYADGQVISPESMFLLHSDCGITLSQVETAGFQCSDVVEYASLLHGYRLMAVDVTGWREDLLFKIDGKWRPLITLKELRDDGYPDLAESLRQSIVRDWLKGKHDLPPGMDVAHMKLEEFR